MDKINLEILPHNTLIELARMYSRNWQTLDSLWFSNVEAECGLEQAIKIDLQNWEKQAILEAKRLKKVLNLRSSLSSVLTCLSMMSWQLTSPLFEIEFESPERIIFYYTQCAVQESRASKRKPTFPCKQMKLTLLTGIAGVIEPKAVVKCLHAPPEARQGTQWCRWELTR